MAFQINMPSVPTYAGGQLGPAVSGNTLEDVANMAQINTSQQALKKAKATFGSDVQSAQAAAEKATTDAKNANLDFGNKTLNTVYTVISPYATDKRVLEAESLTPESTKEQIDAVRNNLLDVGEESIKELVGRGIPKAEAYRLVAPHFMETEADPRKAAQNIMMTSQKLKMATQKLAGAANIAEQNQPSFQKNAAGEFVQVTPARNQVGNVGGGGANANPTTGGVSSTTEYIKDLGGRVQSGILMDIKLNEAEQLLGQFKAGAGTKAYQDIAQRLQAIGAPQDLVDKVSGGDLSAVQSVNKFIAQAVTQGAAQAGGGGSTANILNEYVKNNPDVNNDPRALKRFIEFAKKQNELAYKENEFLLQQKQGGKFNPETHIQEMQQHLREQYLGPQKKETQETSKSENKPQETKTVRKIVKEGVDKRTGQKVVQYDDGTIGYK